MTETPTSKTPTSKTPTSETTVDHVDLDSDPFADDLSAQLSSAARPWHNRATVVLAALALVVGGFLGGVLVEKNYGRSAAADAAAAQRAALANALGNGTFPRRDATAAPSASPAAQTSTGTIKLIDGTTVYLSLASGDVLTVRTSSSTRIAVGPVTKVSGLKVGQKLVVTGPTDSSGNVTAVSITAG